MCLFFRLLTLITILGPATAFSQDENTFVISEKVEAGDTDQVSSDRLATRAKGVCKGPYELVDRVVDKKTAKATIKCLNQLDARTAAGSKLEDQKRPKETFARLRFAIGLLPSCTGETIGTGRVYCGEKYSAAVVTGPGFNTRLMLNHYSLHKADSAPRLEEQATKWRKEELHATAVMVAQGTEIIGFNLGFGLGYFGGALNQREWIEYPFPQEDETLAKERGMARGLAMEIYLERNFAATALGNFNIGLSATGLFPSTTSNPRVESKYWILPALEFSWNIDLKR